jgi:hypothetical protein
MAEQKSIGRGTLLLIGLGAPAIFGACIAAGIVAAAMVKSGGTTPDVRPPSPPTYSLASLIPEPETQVKVGAFYRDLAAAVASPEVKTLDQFRSGQQTAVKILQGTVQFPPVPAAANAEISKRLEDAAGLEPGPLSDQQRQALRDAMNAIAAELLPDV